MPKILSTHELWIEGVGGQLRSCGEGELHAAYLAAGFSTLSSAALRLRVKRRSGRYSTNNSGCKITVTFLPSTAPSVIPHHDRHASRTNARRVKSAVEKHYDDVFVLVGALQCSIGSFLKLNKVLAFETATARDADGRKRRKKTQCHGNNVSVFFVC